MSIKEPKWLAVLSPLEMLSLIQEAKQMIGITRSEFTRQALTKKLSLIKSKPRKEERGKTAQGNEGRR